LPQNEGAKNNPKHLSTTTLKTATYPISKKENATIHALFEPQMLESASQR